MSDSQYPRKRSVSPARSKARSTVSYSKNSVCVVEFARLSLLPPGPLFCKRCRTTLDSTPSIRFGSYLVFEKQKSAAKSDIKNTSDDERVQKQWNTEIDINEKAGDVAGTVGRIRNADQKLKLPCAASARMGTSRARWSETVPFDVWRREKKETLHSGELWTKKTRGGPTKGSARLVAQTH